MQEETRELPFLDQWSLPERAAIASRLTVRSLLRAERLVETGAAATSLFFVRYGELRRPGGPRAGDVVFGAGSMIGAEAFFARGAHHADIVASRVSQVLALSRSDYDALLADFPELASALLETLVRQLHSRGHETSGAAPGDEPLERKPAVMIVPLCGEAANAAFTSALVRRLPPQSTLVVDRQSVIRAGVADGPDDGRLAPWLERQMASGKQLIYLAGDADCPWSDRWRRHADEVVMVTEGSPSANGDHPVLNRILASFEPERRRLVRLHAERQGVVNGTAAWLERIPAAMHHHVCLTDDADIDALIRFMTGTAVGFVGGGGGGLGSAYSGICRALDERGVEFDYLLGTSVGSSMLAGLAYLGDHRTLAEGTEYIFVRRRSFKKLTFPRHSLLDHKTFDRALQDTYGARTRIEDCWKPYAAIATNLSAKRVELMRTGLLWHAVRASTAVPCVLPPFITEDGMLLVDGSIMNDAPLDVMRALKAGPNVVVHFGRPGVRRVKLDYADLPDRPGVLRSFVPIGRPRQRAPGILSMLYRTMLVHQDYDLAPAPGDLVLNPPSFPGASMVNFDNHRAVTAAAYEWTQKELARRFPGLGEARPVMLAEARAA